MEGSEIRLPWPGLRTDSSGNSRSGVRTVQENVCSRGFLRGVEHRDSLSKRVLGCVAICLLTAYAASYPWHAIPSGLSL